MKTPSWDRRQVFFCYQTCIPSSLPFLEEMNHLVQAGGFSYMVLSGVQVCLGRGDIKWAGFGFPATV